MILDNLETPGISSQGQNWAFFTDGVMGGLSQGKAIISKVNEREKYSETRKIDDSNNKSFSLDSAHEASNLSLIHI